MLLSKKDAREFYSKVRGLMDSGTITGLQIYMDFPMDSIELFHDELTRDYFSPMDQAKGRYWYGIFQGTGQSELFVPRFIWAAGKEKIR